MSFKKKQTDDGMDKFVEELDEVLENIRETLIKKRQDYGSENLKKFGSFGVLVRLNDKLERIRNWFRKGTDVETNFESIGDSWLDTLGYSILGYIEHKNNNYTGK